MKKIIKISLLVTLLALISQTSFAQNKVDEKGLKQGVWSKSDKKGNKIYQGTFKDDYEVGVFTYYYEDGKTIKARTEYKDKGNFANSKLFNKEGVIISDGFYKNRKKDSLWTLYDANNKKIGEERYSNGLKKGQSNYWDRQGVLVETIDYNKDLKNGMYYKNTFEDGYFYLTFKDDKRNGPYEDFYYHQKLKIKGFYKDDMKEGEWKFFDSIGNNVKIQVWKNDERISEKVRLDFGRDEKYIETKDIAYFVPTGKRLKIVLFSEEEISCINHIEEFLDILDVNDFIQLNGKMKFYSHFKALKGIGKKVGEEYEIILQPKTTMKILSDKDSRKALELLFQKQEF
ncbi:MAG: hypothetical protein WC135_08045 [Bacteroidales bacterium]